MVGIIDYGLGNLRSVTGAVEKLGYEAVVSGSIAELERVDRLILPGVGAFGDGMGNLTRLGLIAPLTRMVVDQGKPCLGICLGAELMARESDEFGHHEGLGWIAASVTRIVPDDPAVRVPHVGWNAVRHSGDSLLFHDIPQDALFYFVHSYKICCDTPATAVAACDYGGSVTAAIQRGRIFGTQFHPEKSQKHGLALLRNFLSLS
jgi:glutamine amidotransferase